MQKLLALGDSYTIGEAVPPEKRWPEQLATHLNANGARIEQPVHIIAKTGWTTDELLQAIADYPARLRADWVSLQIGVNNQYRNYPFTQFQNEFEQLLNIALTTVNQKHPRVFVLSIPDWGQTPFGLQCGRDLLQVSREINEYNQFLFEYCQTQHIRFVDITQITRAQSNNESAHAEDGLHPSQHMYQAWVSAILTKNSFRR